jgi:hypothetical protein
MLPHGERHGDATQYFYFPSAYAPISQIGFLYENRLSLSDLPV